MNKDIATVLLIGMGITARHTLVNVIPDDSRVPDHSTHNAIGALPMRLPRDRIRANVTLIRSQGIDVSCIKAHATLSATAATTERSRWTLVETEQKIA